MMMMICQVKWERRLSCNDDVGDEYIVIICIGIVDIGLREGEI